MQNSMSILFGFGLVGLTTRPATAATELTMLSHEDLAGFVFSVLVFAGLIQGVFYLLHLYRKRN